MTDARRELSPREAAAGLVRRLHQVGHVAYFVGGCVRDRLLGHEPVEFDALQRMPVPDQVRAIFPGARMVGESFGVMLVCAHGHVIEVATFRPTAYPVIIGDLIPWCSRTSGKTSSGVIS